MYCKVYVLPDLEVRTAQLLIRKNWEIELNRLMFMNSIITKTAPMEQTLTKSENAQ